jgi:hypothetical protein
VQTFLPYADYLRSAKVLDRQRLGKQRLEVLWIMNSLHEVNSEPGQPVKLANHPAVRMWRGYEPQLCEYGITVCEEWIARGYRDATKVKLEWHLDMATSGEYTLDKPPWFGRPDVHLSHQSNLLRKDLVYYGQFFRDVPTNLPYVWPVD